MKFKKSKSVFVAVTISVLAGLAACGDTEEPAAVSVTTTAAVAEALSEVGETNPVSVSGSALPDAPQNGDVEDAAVGLVAPTVTGSGLDGNPVTIGNDGRAKAVVFVAHWCPHCQRELPVLAELVSSGQIPEGMDLYIVSTAVFADRDNYPPNPWLAESGIDATFMTDSEGFDALRAYGAGGFPYSVYLNSDNEVVGRSQGQATPEAIAQFWASTVAG